ncbi:hypothetical protein M8J76_002837 [Diaphorina citri]|nr:hypothetical protein M8J75_000457 [Diaphorina citri]KAI5740335.1 hypothetical protein M8J76_002837 [Diaphorina citri]
MSLKICQFVSQSGRSFSTSSASYGKKNFRKFNWINRGTQQHREEQKLNPDPRFTPTYGVRKVLQTSDGRPVVETIPELIVPNLEGFNLKPYVSYRTNEIQTPEFTAKDLFIEVYAEKINKDFEANKLDEDGNPLQPSDNELLTPEEAEIRARKTGSDLFDQEVDVGDRTQITKDYYL